MLIRSFSSSNLSSSLSKYRRLSLNYLHSQFNKAMLTKCTASITPSKKADIWIAQTWFRNGPKILSCKNLTFLRWGLCRSVRFGTIRPRTGSTLRSATRWYSNLTTKQWHHRLKQKTTLKSERSKFGLTTKNKIFSAWSSSMWTRRQSSKLESSTKTQIRENSK